ncbi:hypothetical protein T492DRAFT_866207 [Pavlovales sp. CCMP2436]|nr:hypothetical protein T492DRAFT_866207 [Pavlovales sp. CCMP2436]
MRTAMQWQPLQWRPLRCAAAAVAAVAELARAAATAPPVGGAVWLATMMLLFATRGGGPHAETPLKATKATTTMLLPAAAAVGCASRAAVGAASHGGGPHAETPLKATKATTMLIPAAAATPLKATKATTMLLPAAAAVYALAASRCCPLEKLLIERRIRQEQGELAESEPSGYAVAQEHCVVWSLAQPPALLLRLGVVYAFAAALGGWIATQTYEFSEEALQVVLAANMGGAFSLLVFFLRIYSGWSYVSDRLGMEVLDYEYSRFPVFAAYSTAVTAA